MQLIFEKYLIPRGRALCRRVFASLAFASMSASWGQAASTGPFIKCTGPDGRPIVVDKSRVRDCVGRPMTEVSPGGLPRGPMAPLESPAEASKRADEEQEARIKHKAEKDEFERKQSLFKKYPNEASVRKGREKELEPQRAAMARAEKRLAELAAKRKSLNDEAEFYIGKPMPRKLIERFQENDALVAAQTELIQHARDEEALADERCRQNIETLRPLWDQANSTSSAPAARQAKASR